MLFGRPPRGVGGCITPIGRKYLTDSNNLESIVLQYNKHATAFINTDGVVMFSKISFRCIDNSNERIAYENVIPLQHSLSEVIAK